MRRLKNAVALRILEGMTFIVACLVDMRSMLVRDLEHKIMADMEE